MCFGVLGGEIPPRGQGDLAWSQVASLKCRRPDLRSTHLSTHYCSLWWAGMALVAWCANTPRLMASSWCSAQNIYSSTCESGGRAGEEKPDCQRTAKLGHEKFGLPPGGCISLECVLTKDGFENQLDIRHFTCRGQWGQTGYQV